MKHTLSVLFFLPLLAFGQEQTTKVEAPTNVSTSVEFNSNNSGVIGVLNGQRDKQGTYYQGNGEYVIVQVGNTFRTNVDKMERDALVIAEEITQLKGASSYRKTSAEKTKASVGKFAQVKVGIQLIDALGIAFLDKEEQKESAKKKLIELNEFKNLGILSQEEFDKAAEPLKKIILDL